MVQMHNWLAGSVPTPDRKSPHLSLHHITIFVRDQDRSKCFYIDQLGFRLIVDARLENGGRWIAVVPQDGATAVALVTPSPDSPEYNLIGRGSQIVFVTDDVHAK